MISVVSFFTPIDDGGMPESWSTITKSKVETLFNLTIFDEPLVPNFGLVLGVVQSLRGQDEVIVWSKNCKILSTFRVKNVHLEVGK